MFLLKTFLIMCFVFLAVYMWPVLGRTESKEQPNITQDIEFGDDPSLLNDTSVNISAEYSLYIPKLNIRAPVVFEISGLDEKIYEKLENGVVHYAGTPKPGEAGTSVILGHSSAYPWYRGRYGKIFAGLSELRAGDLITISLGGNILNYKVKESLIITSDNIVEADRFGITDGSALVLMTCWPTGTNAKRLAIKAEIIN